MCLLPYCPGGLLLLGEEEMLILKVLRLDAELLVFLNLLDLLDLLSDQVNLLLLGEALIPKRLGEG